MRIQRAILPSDQERREVLSESAVFYQPRDVVSGDFYWFKAVGSRRVFSAIDCTGHGVPGAFLSLVGHNALDRVTKVYTEPHKVLDHLNTHVLASCEKTSKPWRASPTIWSAIWPCRWRVWVRPVAGTSSRTAWTWAWPRSTGRR